MKFVLAAAFMAFAVLQIGTVSATSKPAPKLDIKIRPDQLNVLLGIAGDCAQKYKNIKYNKILDPTYEPKRINEMCFVGCVLDKDGLDYYSKGKINEENIQKIFPESVYGQTVTNAINYCAKENIRFCGCEIPFKLFRCFQNLGLTLSP